MVLTHPAPFSQNRTVACLREKPALKRMPGAGIPKPVISMLVLAGLCCPAGGQAPRGAAPLTLGDCVRLAEQAPSTVRLAAQEREIASRGITQARAAFLPQARLSNGVIYNSPLLDNRQMFSFIPLNGIREYSSLVTIGQDFDTSGRLRAELARARSAEDAAVISAAIARRDLRRAVAAAYYRALLARRAAAILAEALEESRSFEERTRLLFAAGEAARADVIKAAAQTALLEQSLNAARLDARLAAQDLASFWTVESSADIALAEALEEPPPPPQAPAEGAPYMRRLEFRLFDAQRRGFEADLRQARSALLPQLSFLFQYGIDSTAVRIRDRGYAAYFNLNIPIFDWNRARSVMAQARLRTRQTETTRAISERLLSRDYQNALARVNELYRQIQLTREQARLAEEDLRLSRLRYEGGEGLALDVVTAQNQFAQARISYYASLANYLAARADLEVAAGQ